MVHSKLTITAIILAALAMGFAGVRLLVRWVLPFVLRIRTPGNIRERILLRYQGKEFHAWIFAWFKTRMDWMFIELPGILEPIPHPQNFLDLGCGFGMVSCFLLEYFERSTAYAIEPRIRRMRAAAAAMGDRGHVYQAMAPDFEQADFPAKFDIVFVLDMIHFLSDPMLDLTLKRIRNRLDEGQYLIVRNPILPGRRKSIQYRSYRLVASLMATPMWFRTAEQIVQHIRKAGFDVAPPKMSSRNPELFWFIANASKVDGPVQTAEIEIAPFQMIK
jgi:SAM-dependent methyltransferase